MILQKELCELLRIRLLFSLTRGKIGLFHYTLWCAYKRAPPSPFQPLKNLRGLHKNWNKYYEVGISQYFNFPQNVLIMWQTRENVGRERYWLHVPCTRIKYGNRVCKTRDFCEVVLLKNLKELMATMRIVSVLHETVRYWWKQSITIHAVFQNRAMWHKYFNCWNTYVMDSPKLIFHNPRDRS